MIVIGDQVHGMILASVVGTYFNPLCDRVIANVSDGHLRGGVLYQNYRQNSISAHVVGLEPNWLTRSLLWVSFHYPFVQLDCELLLFEIDSRNMRALELSTKLGFTDIATIPNAFRGGDLIVRGMTRDRCPWLKIKPREVVEGVSGTV